MTNLGSLSGQGSWAYDVNGAGQVVGALQTGPASHAFIWANGQMQDLNTMIPADSGWVLSEARAINNKGQITGFGTVSGQTHAFLLKPRAYRWIKPSGGSWHLTTNGTGTLAVNFLGLQNDGTLAPGITVLNPRASDSSSSAVAQAASDEAAATRSQTISPRPPPNTANHVRTHLR